MATLKEVINGLVHESARDISVIGNCLYFLENYPEKDKEKYMKIAKERLKKVVEKVDSCYIELKGSKLWEEYL